MCGMMSMDVHDMIRHYLPENPATKRLSGKKQTQGGPLPLINGVITPINGRKWVTIGWFHPIWYIKWVYFTPFATAFWAHLAPHPKKNLSSLRLIDSRQTSGCEFFGTTEKVEVDESKRKTRNHGGVSYFVDQSQFWSAILILNDLNAMIKIGSN